MSQAGNPPTRKLPPMAAGQRYGRLVAIKFFDRSRTGKARWYFRCDCGRVITATAVNVRNGHTKSCGCFQAEQRRVSRPKTHGRTDTAEYRIWTGMKQRCLNQKTPDFYRYGGRGITICDRWQKFENFYIDMGSRPSFRHSIDRINNDGPYSPENCRWTTNHEQHRNTRRNHLVVYRDQQMALIDACKLAGLNNNTVVSRLRAGWSIERALSTRARLKSNVVPASCPESRI